MSLISVVAVVPAMVGVLRGERGRRTDSTWSRTRRSTGSRTERRTLTEGVKGSFLWNLTTRRSCRDHIYTQVGGRLPNLVCFSGRLPWILDVLSHYVGANVWGKVVEEEPLEH